MPGGREIYSEWSLIYQLSPGYILLHGQSELIMPWPGDGRVIRRVLMVTMRVCHWVITIKSPLIAADHCWLVSSHWWLASVQCGSVSRSRLEIPARARQRPALGSPARSPSSISLLPHSLPSVSTRATAHEILWAANPCPAATPATSGHYPGQDRVSGEMSRPTTWTGKVVAWIVIKLQRFKTICLIFSLT